MIKSLWTAITGKVSDDSPILDHLPVNLIKPAVAPEPQKYPGTTPKEARERHRKMFKSYEIPTPRLSPLSRYLIEMNELSAIEAARHTVTAIKAKK